MKNRKIKQIVSVLLAVVMLFSTMIPAFSAFALEQGTKGITFEERHMSGHYKVKGTWYTNMNEPHGGYTADTMTQGQVILRWLKENGETNYWAPLYCIQIHTEAADPGAYESEKIDDTSAWAQELSPMTQASIKRVILHGYPNYQGPTPSEVSSKEAAQIATQLLIWDFEMGTNQARSNEKGHVPQGRPANNYDTALVPNWLTLSTAYSQNSLVQECYREILRRCVSHDTKPSFKDMNIQLDQIGVNPDGTKYAYKDITDSNGVVSQFSMIETDNSKIHTMLISDGYGGYKLRIYTDDLSTLTPKDLTVNFTFDKTFYGSSNSLNNTALALKSTKKQTLWYGYLWDPVQYNLSAEISTGNLTIAKSASEFEDNLKKYAGITFNIFDEYNNLYTTVTTDTDGKAYVDNMPAGIYYIEEVMPDDYYVPLDRQTVEVAPGSNVTYDIDNLVKRGHLKVTKTSEDGIVENFKFRLHGVSDSGHKVDITQTTDASGYAYFNDVFVGTYTLEEIYTDNRYVAQVEQDVTISYGQTSNASFYNKLKKFAVQLQKYDSEYGIPQGDASLAGAQYQVWKDNQLLGTYTTDSNGKVTTDYFVCGTGYTIKELIASEGYLVDTTVYNLDNYSTPDLYDEEKNILQIPWKESEKDIYDVYEQVIKGDIKLVKHTDNGDTQIETPEAGAEFQVYLKSAGSYDAAKDYEKDYLTIDSDGFAQTKKLPYGTYVVHQTKSWEGRELLDDFTVNIQENNKTYSFIINNRNFETYLKVTKTDVETGKTIPYAGAGFQIYNPDGSLVSMSYTYPTPVTIDTFYTNEEGYLVTPEKLPYGLGYKLVEVQAP